MEDNLTSTPLFKKIDQAVFDQIDKFKQTSNYNIIQDIYNSREEEQQKLIKIAIICSIFFIPFLLISALVWQNNTLKDDLDMRKQIISKANEIIGQNQSLREVGPQILSSNPIDSSSMMTSKVSNLLSTMNIDLSKLQVADFGSTMISSNVMRAEADFSFSNFSIDELMNLFTIMIQSEKFRIQSVNINRNSQTNLLQGKFHAIHYSSVSSSEGQD